MRNTSGKWLEKLVGEIEATLLPEGFTVIANERIYNDEGNQIAEFDIEIEGKLGSATIKWLIECRDRPSEGPAPGAWIEQLVGRRDRFNFDKVTAVSTTDFAPGAVEFAEEKGIDLRSIKDLTVEDIEDWMQITYLDGIVNYGDAKHITLVGEHNTSIEAINAFDEIIVNSGIDTPLLVHTDTQGMISMADAWREIVNQRPEMFDGLEINDDPRKLLIVVNYDNPNNRYKVQTKNGDVHIVQIQFHVELSIKHRRIPISQITQYSRITENESIAQSALFKFDTGDKILNIAFHNFGEKDKTFISVQAE